MRDMQDVYQFLQRMHATVSQPQLAGWNVGTTYTRRPFNATPARIGRTSYVLAEDAYGTGPVTRAITSLRGRVRHGDSGAPAVDGRGAVELTVFAARLGAVGGYGVPSEVVRADVIRARGPVSSGDCAP